jgi:hypothetical protein
VPRLVAASFALALALSVPVAALADVPPADGGADPDCTVAWQSVDGTTCTECVVASSDTSCQLQLGTSYNFACQQSATVQVWCTGPARTTTQNPGCALGGSPVPGVPAGGAAMAALIGIAAWAMRRR